MGWSIQVFTLVQQTRHYESIPTAGGSVPGVPEAQAPVMGPDEDSESELGSPPSALFLYQTQEMPPKRNERFNKQPIDLRDR